MIERVESTTWVGDAGFDIYVLFLSNTLLSLSLSLSIYIYIYIYIYMRGERERERDTHTHTHNFQDCESVEICSQYRPLRLSL